MKINKMNYEAFAIDYIEGTLDEVMQTEMDTFLKDHPELKAELVAVSQYELPELPALVYSDKQDLKKGNSRIALWPILSIAATLLLLVLFLLPQMQPSDIPSENPIESKLTSNEDIPQEPADLNPVTPEEDPKEAEPQEVDGSSEQLASLSEQKTLKKHLDPIGPVVSNPPSQSELDVEKIAAVTTEETDLLPIATEKLEKTEIMESDELLAPELPKRTITPATAIASLEINKIDSKPLDMPVVVDLSAAEDQETIAENQSALQKIYKKIQPEVFDKRPLGSIKEALVPEALADLFNNRTKVD